MAGVGYILVCLFAWVVFDLMVGENGGIIYHLVHRNKPPKEDLFCIRNGYYCYTCPASKSEYANRAMLRLASILNESTN